MDFKSSEHPISWFREQYMAGNLELRPPYQRKPVWTAKQKCYLIESILKGLPIPELYIQRQTDAEGKSLYGIVDGQQRVRSVLQFIGCEADANEYNKFALDKLPADSQWRNVAFAELSPEERKRFYDFSFSVRYLNTDSEGEVREMFRRLNRYLTPLNGQELRNATYLGPFVQLVSKLADNQYWAENRIVSPAQIRRMRDVEFVSELIIGVLHGPQGGSAKVVDSYYEKYEDYEDEFPNQREIERLFGVTLDTVKSLFPKIKEVRWHNVTDFYTLFVGLAFLLRSHDLPSRKRVHLRRRLMVFADNVKARLADDAARVPEEAMKYVRAVEKGANDKKRRADRHKALVSVMNMHFRSKMGER